MLPCGTSDEGEPAYFRRNEDEAACSCPACACFIRTKWAQPVTLRASRMAQRRTGIDGRPHHRRRGDSRQSGAGLRRVGLGRPVQDGQRRHDLDADLRSPIHDFDRRHRRRPPQSGRGVGWHRRGERAQQCFVRRRRLQDARWRQDLAELGTPGHAPHLAHRHQSAQHKHRVRGRPRAQYRTERRARRLHDHGWRGNLEEGSVHRRRARLCGHGHRSEQSEHRLRGHVAVRPQAVAVPLGK